MMGHILHQLKVKPDLIISSPANRAAMTARIIAYEIQYPLSQIQYNEAVYYSSGIDLLDIIADIDDSIKEAMLVGHNPELTSLANTLGNSPVSNIPTSAVFCLDLEIPSWSKIEDTTGELRFFEFPKKHQ